MDKKRTILLVLRSGGDFTFEDVQLIARHINGKWQSPVLPRIICLWDKASGHYDIDGFEVMPLKSTLPGTWARMELYSPEMEEYRPYLYIDLDTAVINSLEKLIDIITDENKFITLEDFWQKGQLATGLAWIPANSEKICKIWNSFKVVTGSRMDRYIRQVTTADLFWQDLTNTIYDFKPKNRILLNSIPHGANIICFHGKPRISHQIGLGWISNYIDQRVFFNGLVSVIIPYKEDRGWLQDAINSVPKNVQLLLGKGDGNWPANFNKMLPKAKGKFIRYLHEDDMLSVNCIEDSLQAFEDTGADFIHGNAEEFYSFKTDRIIFKPKIKNPTLTDMLTKNYIHSATLMYRREVFEKLGGFDERLNTAEEYEFSLRCLKAGMKLGYCSAILAHYRRHPLQKVRIVPKNEKISEREMVRKWYRA
jgi:hypothetical protein